MSPSRRPPGSASGFSRLSGPVLALLIAAGLALPSAHAAQTVAKRTAKAASAGSEAAPNLAKSELADIADLRKRMSARTVVVTRHAEVDDIAIQVWARTTLPKKYYVAVTQQGTVRRTLTANDEAEAWRSYDSFRRMAGLGEVGRPVLLGQQMPASPEPSARVPASVAVTASPAAPLPSPPPAVALVSPPVLPTMPPTVLPVVSPAVSPAVSPIVSPIASPPLLSPAAPLTPAARATATPDVEVAARPPSPRSDAPMAAREISATTGEPVGLAAAGYAVETLRRARFGDEVARLVWSAESSQYFVSLTRQGSVVAMLRSRDATEANRAYEDYVRQAEKRASLLPGRGAAPKSSASR